MYCKKVLPLGMVRNSLKGLVFWFVSEQTLSKCEIISPCNLYHVTLSKIPKFPRNANTILYICEKKTANDNSELRGPCLVRHGGLYRWRENSLTFFSYQKLKEILTKYIRTILTTSKDWLISKF